MPRHFLPAELNMATTVPSFWVGGVIDNFY